MKLDPHKTALLVIDMQKDFYAPGGVTDKRGKSLKQMQALPAKINVFADKLRERGIKIVFTKLIYDPARSPANYTEIKQRSGRAFACQAGTDGAEFAGVTVRDEDTVIEKLTYDCFAGTNLASTLKGWQTENVIITGVRTEVCVLATASRSFAEGFRTFVVSDLVGTSDDKQPVAGVVLDLLRQSGYVLTSEGLDAAP